MSSDLVYCRVSAIDDTPLDQIRQITAAGFHVEPGCTVSETISGSTTAMERPEFVRLLARLETDDALITTKLDRLGRNAMDVQRTLEILAKKGVRVHCLALGSQNLTGPEGEPTMAILNAIADFELDLLVERTQTGLIRAQGGAQGPGRPAVLSPKQDELIRKRRAEGVSLGVLAKEFGVSRSAIQRAEKRAVDMSFSPIKNQKSSSK